MGVGLANFSSGGLMTSHAVPGVYSRSVNTLKNTGVSAGNLCIIGRCSGGEPGRLFCFGSVSEAKEILLGGELLTAVACAFNGSSTYTPQRVYAMRVDSATQSELTLENASGGKIMSIKAWDWGAHTNRVAVQIDAGKKVIVTCGTETYEKSFGQDAMTVESGGETLTSVRFDGKKVVLNEDESGAVVLNDGETITELMADIESKGFKCTLMNLDGKALASHIDTGDIADNGGKFTLTCNAESFVNALAGCKYIGSVDVNSYEAIPTTGKQYFSGGANGEVDDGVDYAKALTILEACDVQIIATPSTSIAVHTLISNHCTQMSSTTNRKERTAILGCDVNASDEDILNEAKGLNNKLVSLVSDSATISNALNGAVMTANGALVACMLAGMESSMAVNEPLTNKSLKLLDVQKRRTISQMEALILGGSLCVNVSPDNSAEFVCIRAITTFQGNNDLISCERSMVREDLYMNRDLRAKFAISIGRPNKGNTGDIIATLKDAANSWAGNGYIVTGENGNVWNIKVRIDGDKIYLDFDRYLTAPTNFVFFTVTNNVYSTSIEL